MNTLRRCPFNRVTGAIWYLNIDTGEVAAERVCTVRCSPRRDLEIEAALTLMRPST